MIVSVHLPKTAGSSFAKALEAHFGDRLLLDYGDLPLHRPAWRRNWETTAAGVRLLRRPLSSVDCVHGHFLPAKYRWLGWRRRVQFVTWLREPVERLASHYHYWRRSYDAGTSATLHRRVVEERWSFERFALGAELQNTYCQFLWTFPLSRFAFVGITEHFDDDFRQFTSRFLGRALPIHHELANDERTEGAYGLDPSLRRRIEAHHAADVDLYRQALARRARAAAERPLGR
jgi:hypothetical protein